MDKVTSYINPMKYLQHNSVVADGLDGFGAAMEYHNCTEYWVKGILFYLLVKENSVKQTT